MIPQLRQLDLPNDQLIQLMRKRHRMDIEKEIPTCKTMQPFTKRITLELVKCPTVQQMAKTYIEHLLKNKNDCGYLYFLINQPLFVKLDIRFNGEMAIQCSRRDEIVTIIEDLAKTWARENTMLYEVTRLELLYFLVLLINPHLNWVAVDFLLKGTRNHTHLIVAPHRLLKNKKLTL